MTFCPSEMVTAFMQDAPYSTSIVKTTMRKQNKMKLFLDFTLSYRG